MKRVILECKGRLANQIICWANARRFMVELSLTDWLIIIKHTVPRGCVEFPGAMVDMQASTAGLPTLTRQEIQSYDSDCVWSWNDVFTFDGLESLMDTIRTIRLTDAFDLRLSSFAHPGLVGLHVRCGDFEVPTSANPNPEFRRAHPAEFLTAIQLVRKQIGNSFYVSTDGTPGEIDFLKRLGLDIRYGIPGDPLFDLFALSRCRLVIETDRSSFGWLGAAYGNKRTIYSGMPQPEIERIIQLATQ